MEGTERKPAHVKKHEEPAKPVTWGESMERAVVDNSPPDPVMERFKHYRNQMTYGSQKGDLDVAAAILTLAYWVQRAVR